MSYLQQQRQRYHQRREETEKAMALRGVTGDSREDVLLDMDRQFHSAFQKLQNTFTEQNEAELKVLKNWGLASLHPRVPESPSGATLEYSSSDPQRHPHTPSARPGLAAPLQVSERRTPPLRRVPLDTRVLKAPVGGVGARPLLSNSLDKRPLQLSSMLQRPLRQNPVVQPSQQQMGPVVQRHQQMGPVVQRPLRQSPVVQRHQQMGPVVQPLSQQSALRAQERRPLHPRTVHHMASRSAITSPKVLIRPQCQTRRVPLIPSHAMMRSARRTSETRASLSSLIEAPNKSLSSLIEAPNKSLSSLIEAPNKSLSSLIEPPNKSSSSLIKAPNKSFSDTQTLNDDRPHWARLLCRTC